MIMQAWVLHEREQWKKEIWGNANQFHSSLHHVVMHDNTTTPPNLLSQVNVQIFMQIQKTPFIAASATILFIFATKDKSNEI